MSRRTQIVVLCEDNQHESFALRFLQLCGYKSVRVEKSPKGRGSGEQWVRARYAREVGALRQAPYITGRALVVVVDEDTAVTEDRATTLAAALVAEKQSPRAPEERVIHVIPERNIETWLAYLRGETVDSTKEYAKLRNNERACQPMVVALKQMCDKGALRQPAPRSLELACQEFRSRMP